MIRYATDPVVDIFFFILQRAFLPLLFRLVQPIIPGLSMNRHSLFDQTSESGDNSVSHSVSHGLHYADHVSTQDKDVYIISFSNITGSILDSRFVAQGHEFFHHIFAPESLFMQYAGVYFAVLGKRVRLTHTAMQGVWINLANGDSALDRVFGVVLGYAVVGFFIALYLNVLNVGTVQSAGRAVRNAVRQQVIIVKVNLQNVHYAQSDIGCIGCTLHHY